MTTTRIGPAGISGLVSFVHDLRPEWDRRGIAAAVHRLADQIPAAPLALAFIRGASDPANETPAAVTFLENRAWTDWWPKCKDHPEQRARRLNGECASCWADRQAAPPPQPIVHGERAHPLREAIEKACPRSANPATAVPRSSRHPNSRQGTGTEPWRSHYHYVEGPGKPVVVVYYDQPPDPHAESCECESCLSDEALRWVGL